MEEVISKKRKVKHSQLEEGSIDNPELVVERKTELIRLMLQTLKNFGFE